MKRKSSVLLSFVLITVLCVIGFSSCGSDREFRFGAYRYTVENEEVTITKYSGMAADVTGPESIRGMPVVLKTQDI